jgi:hypothetical protein
LLACCRNSISDMSRYLSIISHEGNAKATVCAAHHSFLPYIQGSSVQPTIMWTVVASDWLCVCLKQWHGRIATVACYVVYQTPLRCITLSALWLVSSALFRVCQRHTMAQCSVRLVRYRKALLRYTTCCAIVVTLLCYHAVHLAPVLAN